MMDITILYIVKTRRNPLCFYSLTNTSHCIYERRLIIHHHVTFSSYIQLTTGTIFIHWSALYKGEINFLNLHGEVDMH